MLGARCRWSYITISPIGPARTRKGGLSFCTVQANEESVADDPTHTDPDKYKVVFENERVRVLEYQDRPGERTTPHRHPDSVMYTLSGFARRLVVDAGDSRDLALEPGEVRWLSAQTHMGENIGDTPTHVLFVELKDGPSGQPDGALGPS